MKKALLKTLVIWAVLGASYWYLFRDRYDPPQNWIGALVGSFLTTLGIGCLRNIAFSAKEAQLIRRSRETVLPSRAGLAAVAGRITSREPLTAPFSGAPCVMYDYEAFVERVSGSGSQRNTVHEQIYTGIRTAPCVVRGATGDVKILGYPHLVTFPKDDYDPSELSAKFFAETTFEDLSGVSLKKRLGAFSAMIGDDDGVMNLHYRHHERFNSDELELREQIVPLDSEVCIVGGYSPERKGFTSELNGPYGILRLYRGGAEEALGDLRAKMFLSAFGALFFLGLGTVAVWKVLDLHETSTTVLRERGEKLIHAVDEDNVDAATKLAARLPSLDSTEHFGETPLSRAQSYNMVRALVAAGAKPDLADRDGRTPLMIASLKGRKDAVVALLDSKADVNHRDANGDTALSIALSNGDAEMADLLRRSGAIDDTVTAENGSAVTVASESVKTCFEYIAAIHRSDLPAMKRLLSARGDSSFEYLDFGIWQSSRPKDPVLVNGFENASGATIRIGADAENPIWEYQLERTPQGWRITHERQP